jgi:hypothetical protein
MIIQRRHQWFWYSAALTGFCLLILCVPQQILAAEPIIVESVDAYWEDSLAVLNAHVLDPLSPELQDALRSGVKIQFDFNVYLSQTGYVKRLDDRIQLEYDVWSDRYRVVTPIGRLAINDYRTVLKFFRDDLILLVHKRDLPREGAWFVKVRVEAFPVRSEEGAEAGSLERELRGLTGWLFRRGQSMSRKSDWSILSRLPDPGEDQVR